ncbi:transposase [Escherichia coli]|nr:transposase [Escherichia coli]
MRRFAGACRFVFNRALALQNENHEAGNKSLTGKWLPGWLSGKMPLKRNGLKIRPHSHCNSH